VNCAQLFNFKKICRALWSPNADKGTQHLKFVYFVQTKDSH